MNALCVSNPWWGRLFTSDAVKNKYIFSATSRGVPCVALSFQVLLYQ
jgi:hypothetical protein